ncbi:hypothetical protein ASZ90_016947 [hydrocarbon metagenome]|uniref:Uncharacterized protein n=1 Tax=hydrocarbon metagenome TaxID=938273 RepID=A0A0W8EAH0_9ZZZZ
MARSYVTLSQAARGTTGKEIIRWRRSRADTTREQAPRG